jgi:hypothetical protein
VPEQSAGSAATTVLGVLVSAALGGLAWLAAGATGVIGLLLAGSLSVLSAIGAPIAVIIYQRYLGVLAAGGHPKGSPARLAYEELRDSLSLGNLAARLYSRWLSAFLDAVDRFFGDAGKADQTLFPRAFGLKTPAPLWTAPAFDRCLLLALLYPIAVIFVIWAISGHVGPAEAALGLARDISPWLRGLFVALMASVFVFFVRRGTPTQRRAVAGTFAITVAVVGVLAGNGVVGSFVFIFVVVSAFAVIGGTVAVAGGVVGAFAVAFSVSVSVSVSVSLFTGAFPVVLTVADFAGALADTGSARAIVAAVFAIAVTDAGAFAFVFAVAVAKLSGQAIEHRWHGIFLSLFSLSMIITCLMAAYFFPFLEANFVPFF